MLKEEYLFAKTDSGPTETITIAIHAVAWVILCLYLNMYLVMHYRQSILYRGPKIYNDVPMEIKSLNNPQSFKQNLRKPFFLLLQYV